MAIRNTMVPLISSVRVLINDPSSGTPTFDDQTIQDVLDESRVDVKNQALDARPTFTGTTIQYVDYWSSVGGVTIGGWEDGYVLKQYLTVLVTPTLLEPIAGHFGFSGNVFPPVFISGSLHDRYRAAADLLERLSAKYILNFDVVVGGQTFRQSQQVDMIQKLANSYRAKQRPFMSQLVRSDTRPADSTGNSPLRPRPIDYMSSG